MSNNGNMKSSLNLANKLNHDGEGLVPHILVFGVGGAGCNAVRNMMESGLEGVEFVIANTDAQALELVTVKRKIQLGLTVTQGLGAGSKPNIGYEAAEESIEEIIDCLHNVHMVFITAGMGGGTGTGAAPVIARAARDLGILTVGVVTKPFHFEGTRRQRIAEGGIIELQKHVDTLIVIPNQNLFRLADEATTFSDAFRLADEVLHAGVASITDLMSKPGLINLDFADVRTIMSEMGKAIMGTGEASGENRAMEAAAAAISNPLLDELTMKGARGVLINITGGMDMTLYEVDEAANRVREEVDQDANIIVGSTFDSNMDGKLRVSVVATGLKISEIESGLQSGNRPQAQDSRSTQSQQQTVSIAENGGYAKQHQMRYAMTKKRQSAFSTMSHAWNVSPNFPDEQQADGERGSSGNSDSSIETVVAKSMKEDLAQNHQKKAAEDGPMSDQKTNSLSSQVKINNGHNNDHRTILSASPFATSSNSDDSEKLAGGQQGGFFSRLFGFDGKDSNKTVPFKDEHLQAHDQVSRKNSSANSPTTPSFLKRPR